MTKTTMKNFRWDDEIDAILGEIAEAEPDKPSKSVMMRRLIYRAAGRDELGVRKPGRVPKERVGQPEIATVGLSTRLSNTLINAGIMTVADLKGDIPALTPKLRAELDAFIEGIPPTPHV